MKSNSSLKLFGVIGAGFGLVLFLALALLPSMLYGGYAGLLLANGIMNTTQPTLITKAFVFFGMALGCAGVASLFAVCGAVCGSLIHLLTVRTPAKLMIER